MPQIHYRRTSRYISLALKYMVIGLAIFGVAKADTVVGEVTYDQPNTSLPLPHLFQAIRDFSPIGQSFIPDDALLNFVNLYTTDLGNPVGVTDEGATLVVQIRSGSISGTVLGTSEPVALPDGFPGCIPGVFPCVLTQTTKFQFLSPVALTPGSVYVIDLIQTAGTDWGVGVAGNGGGDPYPRGNEIFNGTAVPDSDLWFDEGFEVPEPTSVAQVVAGLCVGLWMLRSATRKRRLARTNG